MHLISDNPPVQDVKEPFLDRYQAKSGATAAVPGVRYRVSSTVELVWLIEIIVAANVNILTLETALTDDVG